MEYTWSVSRNLAGGFFSTGIFEKFNSFFTQSTNLLLLLITHSLADNIYSVFYIFYNLISFNLLLIIAVSISFCKIFYPYTLKKIS